MPHPCVVCKGGRRCCRHNFCPFCTNPLRMRSWYPPFAKNAKDRAPHVLVMPARSKAWATARTRGNGSGLWRNLEDRATVVLAAGIRRTVEISGTVEDQSRIWLSPINAVEVEGMQDFLSPSVCR